MQSTGIGIGFVGAGFIAALHAHGIATSCRHGGAPASIVACVDRDQNRAAAFADAHGAVVEMSVEALAARPDVDAVLIATPTSSHVEVAEAVAASGKALFCEKPLAFDAAGAMRIVDAANAAHVANQAGLVLRFSPTFRAIRDRLADPANGQLLGIMLRDDQFFPIDGHYGSTWRQDASIAGSGVVLEHSIHDVDVLRWFAGDVVAVSAQTRELQGHPDIEDVGALTLEFESGAVATLLTIWHSIMSRASQRRLEVFCDETMYSTRSDMVGELRVERSDSETVLGGSDVVREVCSSVGAPGALTAHLVDLAASSDARSGLAAYVLQAWSFVDAVSSGRDPQPDLATAVRAHEIVDAAYRAAADGSRVLL